MASPRLGLVMEILNFHVFSSIILIIPWYTSWHRTLLRTVKHVNLSTAASTKSFQEFPSFQEFLRINNMVLHKNKSQSGAVSNIKAYYILWFYYIPETTSKANRISRVVLCLFWRFRENSETTFWLRNLHQTIARPKPRQC